MWLASYVVHLRRVHWRAGADWLVAHLLDGDLASNHLSWQWVAATGSHKPYLFNAENVARFAPAQWHSPGTVIDRSYDDLERVARGGLLRPPPLHALDASALTEPALLSSPPAGLGLTAPGAVAQSLQGREVWLTHPWALRSPPADLPPDTLVLGVYPQEHHAAWPWPQARWRWVDRAMAEVAPQRCFTDAPGLAAALAGAARVRSVDDAHLTRWLQPLARLDPAPALFPKVERHCSSFSQWWTRATRGLTRAQELL
jgi:deoxyribodipyrimidine photo-lyase